MRLPSFHRRVLHVLEFIFCPEASARCPTADALVARLGPGPGARHDWPRRAAGGGVDSSCDAGIREEIGTDEGLLGMRVAERLGASALSDDVGCWVTRRSGRPLSSSVLRRQSP
jgi:hypothetical protein